MKSFVQTLTTAWLMAYSLQSWVFASSPLPPAEQAGVRASSGCGVEPPLAPGETGVFSMRVDDLERGYRLHLPTDYDGTRPVELVLVFHGYNGTAELAEAYTGFSRLGDQHGFVVVYPEATSFLTAEGERISSWNDLSCNASPGPQGPICSETAFKYPHPPDCGEPRPCNWCTCSDDLGFVVRLLDRLGETLCIDLDGVFATGMSNGGMFVHRLGCDLPDRFAAIAPVSGTLARGFNCAPDKKSPLSVMNIYGSEDRYVALDGTMSSDGYYYTSAADVMDKWAGPDALGCETEITSYETSKDDTLDLTCIERDGCLTGAEVVNCTWNGSHDWPKNEAEDFGTEIIWEFFEKHSRAEYR